MLNTNTAFIDMFNRKPRRISYEKNCIYLSAGTVIEIVVVDGVRWIIVGDPGSGKSYCMGIILNQFKNNWMFDPTGKFKDTIEEQDMRDKWTFWELHPKSRQGFRINVSDFHPRVLDSIFPRAEDTEKKRKQRQAIETFCASTEKTYDRWERLCDENKMDTIFSDMRWILSEDDSARPILDLAKGKNLIDCEGISVRNPSVGVALQCLLGARSTMPKVYLLDADNFICISLDEAQDYAKGQTPSGNALASLSLQARKYGIGEILAGSAYDSIHPDCRAKSNMKLVFSSPGITDKYRREGIDLIQDDWQKLDEHECFLYSSDGRFKGATGNDKCLPDMYWKKLKQLNKIPNTIIKRDNTQFEFRRNIFN